MKNILLTLTLLFTLNTISQSSPIIIDGKFDDWTDNLSTYTDIFETGNDIDILEIQVTNDTEFLFLRVKLNQEINLTNDMITQYLRLQIDTDNNPNTGYNAQVGFGSEIGIIFKEMKVFHNATIPVTKLNYTEIGFRSAPAYTSDEFEIAISRNAAPNGLALFPSQTIRILFQNTSTNGDDIPNVNEYFTYTFDDTQTYNYDVINIDKENPNYIRVLSYNTRHDGLINTTTSEYFENIIKSLNPDIITFQECPNTEWYQVKDSLNNWLPLGNGNTWKVRKLNSLITASKYTISHYWGISPYINNNGETIHNQLATLIDLPSNYPKDVLITNTHLISNLNVIGDPNTIDFVRSNNIRQRQIDEYIQFILEAKSTNNNINYPVGGYITLPYNTPFLQTGDFNMYGYKQQLTSLITGEIMNTVDFGEGAPLDWDNSNLSNEISLQTDKRMAYTWRRDKSHFDDDGNINFHIAPGKLDYFIYSDAVMQIEKSYVLQTEVMPTERLTLYNLNQNDTKFASDHFPIVMDFSILSSLSVSESKVDSVKIYPNPTSKILNIINLSHSKLKIFDIYGKHIKSYEINNSFKTIDVEFLKSGVYFMKLLNNNGNEITKKLIIK
jgi:endonuclease/exonuclease/phosphatase family metal-dependent hydrolase